MRQELASKKAFFEELYSCAHDDDIKDENQKKAPLTSGQSGYNFVPPQKSLDQTANTQRLIPHMGRTLSAPLPAPTPGFDDATAVTDSQTSLDPQLLNPNIAMHPGFAVPSLKRDNKLVQIKNAKSKPPNKRKRGQSLVTLPESQQIFRGQRLCKYI